MNPETKRAREWSYPCALAAAAFAAFLPILNNGFVWDDRAIVVDNLRFRGLGPDQLRWMLTTFRMGHYQPLSWFTFALDYRLWGMNPSGYHLTSLLLHAANAALFYFVAEILLALALQAKEVRAGAAFAAALFALHPLRVESVAWVTERRDVLSGFFFLLTILFYLKSCASQVDSRRRLLWLSLGAYALSLMSKAIGVSLPVVLLLLDYYPLGRLRKEALLEKLPFFLLAAAAAAAALAAQVSVRELLALSRHGLSARLAQAVFGAAFYLQKTLWPRHLSPLYRLPWDMGLGDWRVLRSGLFLAAAAAGLSWAGLKRRAAGVLWAYYFAVLFPVLGFFQTGPQFVADRYSYLSCLGWALACGAGLVAAKRSSRLRPLWKASALLAALGLGSLAWEQSKIWHDEGSLWSAALRVDGRLVDARINLGAWLMQAGRTEGAISQYRTAFEIDPDNPVLLVHLGFALMRQGRLEEAAGELRRALLLKPNSADAHTYLGVIRLRQGRLREALRHFRVASQLDPESIPAQANLKAVQEALKAGPKRRILFQESSTP